ncbi:MAG: hypothetical protein RLZZ303_426 [Candidatus Hydrogenedentota bacterium]
MEVNNLSETAKPREKPSWPRVLSLGLSVLAVAGLGGLYTATWDGPAMFWQEVFAPAVCIACGHAPANPYFEDVPELADFLYQRTDRFDCAVLDRPGVRWIPWEPDGWSFEELQASHPLREFPGFIRWQHFHLYLLWSVALCWKVLGVSWLSLVPLYAMLFGLSAVFLYGLFRLVCGHWLALLLMLGVALSPLQLEQLPHLRDYAKAPFFLGGMLATGWFIKHPLDWRRSLLLAGATGLFLGVGLGFRQDIAIVVAALMGSVALFHPEPLRKSWRKRLAICAVFLCGFAIFGARIALELREQSNAPHDTLIGLLDYCDERLGVGNPLYDHGDPFKDEYTRAVVERHAATFHVSREPLRHYSAHYDTMASDYFREVILTFPADMVTRAFASVLRVLDELQPRANTPQGWEESSAIFTASSWARLPGTLGNRYSALIAIALLAFLRPKWGLAALCLLYLFAGYPSLRFSTRHVFHLEFISIWIGALFLHAAWNAAWATYSGQWRKWTKDLLRRMIMATTVAAFAVAATLAPWQLLKTWQQPRVEALLAQYEAAPATRLAVDRVGIEGDSALLRPQAIADIEDFPEPERDLPSWCRVLAIDVAAGRDDLSLRFVFSAEDDHYDFTRSLTIPGGASARVYFPLYLTVDNRFEGVALKSSDVERLTAWRRVDGLDAMKILPTAVLPEDWRSQPLAYRILR